jgi:predicted lipoprotein with Yx(FWY)xxD motif
MCKHLLLLVLGASALVAGTASAATQAPQTTVTVRSSAYGKILFDGQGRALYAFACDPHGRSVCKGACAKAWPPYIAKRRPGAATSVKSSLLGTTKRANGSLQATYRGRPLYYYVNDTRPGQVTCQNVSSYGGLWLVLRPNGQVVR